MARALVVALRARGADVRTVLDAGLSGKDDRLQLEWAAAKGRALYTFNVSDFKRRLTSKRSATTYGRSPATL